MNVSIDVNNKQWDASISTGWYKGNEFVLFKLTLCEKYGSMFTLFGLQIAKFEFDLIFDRHN